MAKLSEVAGSARALELKRPRSNFYSHGSQRMLPSFPRCGFQTTDSSSFRVTNGELLLLLMHNKLDQIVLIICFLLKTKQQTNENKEGRGCLVSQSIVMGKP